jgi:parallel beta-helix repeat protein/predicted outer membrane repeat protein
MRYLTLSVLLFVIAPAWSQTTWYVDDNAPSDPGPGDPMVSDPLEDGSVEHPFDAIQEAIFLCQDGDTVLVANGRYTGLFNKNLDFGGKAVTVRSENGAANCVIDCEGDGRGFYFRFGEGPDSVVNGFSITNGQVSDYGGGIRCINSSSPVIINCIIIGNTASTNGGGVYCNDSSSPTITNCTINDNTAVYGGGVYCRIGSPTLTNCTINDNTADGYGGGIYCRDSSSVITNCTISGNTASSFGGGISCYYSSSATLTNCTISDNMGGSGAGVHCSENSSATLTNCTISGNTADDGGGGAHCDYYSDITITNCTITGNTAFDRGGGVHCDYRGDVYLVNSILWGDTANEGAEIAISSSGTVTVSYSDVEYGWYGVFITPGGVLLWDHDTSIALDPLLGSEGHLLSGSPCIDTGDPDVLYSLYERDMDGQLRVWDGGSGWLVDMGADEYASHRPGDMDGDGDVDLSDLAALLSHYRETGDTTPAEGDFDFDGDVDLSDLAALLGVYRR